MHKRTNHLVISLLIMMYLLWGCSSSDSTPEKLDVPASFTTVAAIANTGKINTPTHIDLSPITVGARRSGFSLVGLTETASSLHVGIMRRVEDDTIANSAEFVVFDAINGGFTALMQSHPHHSATVSPDLSTAAWIEECQGYVRRFDQGDSVFHLNPILTGNNCLRPATLSGNGETTLFRNGRGEPDANGILRYAGTDSEQFGPVAYSLDSGMAINLSGKDILLGIADADDNSPLYLHSAISDDGQVIALRTAFVPDNVSELGEIEFVAGILIVNTKSGTYSLIDQHVQQRAFCAKCYWYPADDLQLSGDGKIVYFLRPEDDQLLNPSAESSLFRFDIAKNELQKLPIDDKIDKGSLTIDPSGDTIAYLAGGKPILLQLNTGQRVELDRAIRVCDGEQCIFEDFRFVRSQPLSLSADGSVLLVQVIPEQPDIDSPQNTQEAMLLDTNTLQLWRVAPDVSIDRIEVSASGRQIVFQTESSGLLPDDNDFDTDFFMLDRQTQN